VRAVAAARASQFHLSHPHTGGAAIHAAAQHCADAIPILLRAGARVDSPTRLKKQTPLMVAAMHGNVASLRSLLAAGARPWIVDTSCRTALHHAAGAGSAACVGALLPEMEEVREACPASAPPRGHNSSWRKRSIHSNSGWRRRSMMKQSAGWLRGRQGRQGTWVTAWPSDFLQGITEPYFASGLMLLTAHACSDL